MNTLMKRDAAYFLHQSGSTPVEHAFRSAAGIWVEDEMQHRFMDFHGNTCHNIGYNHPGLLAALWRQMNELSFTGRGFTNEPAVALAEKLSELWPYGKGRVLFGLSGSDAIEIALKLAYVATGRKRTLAFDDSWHGAGLGALWAGGRPSERVAFPPMQGCYHAQPFWPHANGEDAALAAERSLESIRQLFAEVGDFACFIAEPIRSTPHIPPSWYWPAVRTLCDAHGTLLIFDEIPTGLGKTGRLFSSEHFAAAPDITVLGKSLGGGMLPLSAVIAREDLNVSSHLAIGHYTHQKNPLLCRAGLTVLTIIAEENLVHEAESKGRYFSEQLQGVIDKTPLFDGWRGIGLLLALQTADRFKNALPLLKRQFYAKGINVGTAEGKFICLSPPLTIAKSEIDLAIAVLNNHRLEVGGFETAD